MKKKIEYDMEYMGETTSHGDNIADQIVGADVYGDDEILSAKDVWNIVDAIHSQWLFAGIDNVVISDMLKALEEHFPDLDLIG